MAYNGYLIKILGVSGSPPVDYTFPNSKIGFETYSAKENTLYSDSFQDALGVTHAKALAHKIDKVTFKTVQMTNTEFRAIMNEIESRYTESNSRTLNVEYYVPEKDIYAHYGHGYADFEGRRYEQQGNLFTDYIHIHGLVGEHDKLCQL